MRANGAEEMFEQIMDKNFTKLIKDSKPNNPGMPENPKLGEY